jgi:hypothetical protein
VDLSAGVVEVVKQGTGIREQGSEKP